jgi:hypothetical protein
MNNVNIPLLRKAVEWAEAEAMKPPELCEWNQQMFVSGETATSRQRMGKATDCGTCYCIAGWVALQVGEDPRGIDPDSVAAKALGIPNNWLDEGLNEHLFDASNSIEDVRRIAESLAGERL